MDQKNPVKFQPRELLVTITVPTKIHVTTTYGGGTGLKEAKSKITLIKAIGDEKKASVIEIT